MTDDEHQDLLSRIFEISEKDRLEGAGPYEGWGSNRHIDIDSLYDSNTGQQWSRTHPDGPWSLVPPLGSD